MPSPSATHEAIRLAAWNRPWAVLLSPPRDTQPKPALPPRPNDDPESDQDEAA